MILNVGLLTRLTPAYAGNIGHDSECRSSHEAHPRIRGEYINDSNTFTCPWGSPPHTRGISLFDLSTPLCRRLTPAYAGNISKVHGSPLPVQAHPRIRGEYKITRLF